MFVMPFAKRNRIYPPVLVVLIVVVQCAVSWAFQHVATTTSAAGTQRPMQASTFQEDSPEYKNECDPNADIDPVTARATLSRRNAVGTGLSVLTAAVGMPLAKASAAAPDNTTLEPFRVLFTVRIDSSKPDELTELEIEVRPDWAPLAAERFRDLVELGFYRDCPFFRVLPGYVAQFGISSDPDLNKQWMYCDPAADAETRKLCRFPLPDEPRTQPNKRGTLAFASSGKNSRRTQVFVNLANNDGPPNFLDPQGFVPFARIVRGMDEVPKALNAEYGQKVNQGKAAYYGGEYFRAVFPRLSVIADAKIL